MPLILSSLLSSIPQETAHILLIFYAFDIALKKKSISLPERDFFFKYFSEIPNCDSWSDFETDFYSSNNDNIAKNPNLLNELVDLYQELKESSFEKRTFYNDMTMGEFINEQNDLWEELKFNQEPLIKQLNIRLICKDKQFKSLLNCFVHQELKDITEISFDFMKFHKFIKTASWPFPIAIQTAESINLVNTVCSIASYYSVGLEVIRTDDDNSIPRNTISKAINIGEKYWPYIKKSQFVKTYERELFEVDDKRQLQTIEASLDLIKDCAIQGNWVLISTVKFISYWDKMCDLLEELNKNGKIAHTFRLFLDWQNMEKGNLSEVFLYDRAFIFYLTELNSDDMEGFNDVWAHILNSRIIKCMLFTNFI